MSQYTKKEPESKYNEYWNNQIIPSASNYALRMEEMQKAMAQQTQQLLAQQLNQPSPLQQLTFSNVPMTTVTLPYPSTYTYTYTPVDDERLISYGRDVLLALPHDIDGDIQLTHAQYLGAVAAIRADMIYTVHDTPLSFKNMQYEWRGHKLVDVSV